MKIAILDTQKAYLPEINAYINYFQSKGIEASRIFQKDLNDLNRFDLIWKFTGVDFVKNKEIAVIHEYNSLTVGNLKWVKDKLKRNFNVRPNGRVFLNNEIKSSLKFSDNVPSIIRDMGIANNFFITDLKKEYDFVYIGAMDESRQLNKLLHNFNENKCNHKILMVGKPNDELYREFKGNKNIIFTGSVPYEEVPKLASKAIYGLNYIPDIYPYNEQTSTKLLEYCALGLKVITTDYHWVRKFEKQEKATFYKINKDIKNLDFKEIINFEYETPDVTKYEWNRILEEAGLMDIIK